MSRRRCILATTTVVVDVPGFSKVVEHVRLEVGSAWPPMSRWPWALPQKQSKSRHTGAVLETESSTVANLRTEEAVRDLPLNGRNFNELFSLGAGAIPRQPRSIGSIPYTSSAAPRTLPFNGSRSQENRLLLDGIGDQENHNSMTAIFPPIDAIQEFSEEIAGRRRALWPRQRRHHQRGLQVRHRQVSRRRLRVFSQHRSERQKLFQYYQPGRKKAPLRQNEFGVTFGGPVFCKQANPKTFFFADYAGKRFAQGQN